MAKQAGIFLVTGTIGNATFYEDPNDGFLVKQKSSLDKARVYRDKKFKNTLRNAEEFRRAIEGARQLRFAMAQYIKPVADGKLNGRMNAAMLKTLKSDRGHHYGKRCIINGEPGLLENFNFNKNHSLNNLFRAEHRSYIDAATGQMQVDIRSFNPRKDLSIPKGASHFKLVSVASSLEFKAEMPARSEQESALYPVSAGRIPALRLQHSVSTEAGAFLFLALGIEFYTMPGKIPAGMLSQRKHKRLKKCDHLVAYTGAAAILKAVAATQTVTAPVLPSPALIKDSAVEPVKERAAETKTAIAAVIRNKPVLAKGLRPAIPEKGKTQRPDIQFLREAERHGRVKAKTAAHARHVLNTE